MKKYSLIILIGFLIIFESFSIYGIIEQDSFSQSDYSGYIIEFENPSIIEKKVELEQTAEKNKDIFLAKIPLIQEFFVTSGNIDSRMQRYERNLDTEHETIKQKISGFSQNSQKVLGEYKLTFNGISLNISDSEAKEIEKINGVKKVWPNYKVSVLLDQSVPLIQGGIPAGQLDRDGNNCKETGEECLTGAGIKIAIIDTGVDYTHPDLGGGFVDEKRDFEKIPDSALNLWSTYIQQQISLNENRLAYYSDNTIYIYDFNKKTTKEINPLQNFKIINLKLYGDSLIYTAENLSTISQISLYLYNLTTGKNIEINNFVMQKPNGGYEGNMGSFGIGNEKIVYLQGDFQIINETSWFISNIYVYDINTNTKTKITNGNLNNLISNPVVSGDLIAYPTFHINGYCYDKIILYNMKTGERTEIKDVPYLGGVRDLKGDKLLYLGCGERINAYYLYDLSTDKYERIAPPSEENSIKEMNAKENKGRWFFISGWINDAKIDINSDLVFFSADSNGNKISVYDRKNKKYTEINPVTLSRDFDAEGGRVCFISNQKRIYCHKYKEDYDYPPPYFEFGNKVIGGYDFINNDDNPIDDNGHGTHVAATAAGNGVLKGVAPEANILAYKVLDSGGSGYMGTIILAIERAVKDKADIISMSLGGRGNPDDPVSTSIDNAVDAGVIAVIAAGNDGPSEKTIDSPGTARKAITVGATDKQDNLATFSSRGPVIWKDDAGNERFITKPDILAPGADICAAEYDSAWNDRKCFDDNHISISGTSMATPHVAGAVALLKQKNPDWTPEEIKAILKETSKDLGLSPNSQGSGRINLTKSVTAEIPPLIPAYSKIENLGDTTADINLLIKIQKFENNEWIDYMEVINDDYLILSKKDLELAELFNNQNVIIPTAGLYRLNITAIDSGYKEIINSSAVEFSVI